MKKSCIVIIATTFILWSFSGYSQSKITETKVIPANLSKSGEPEFVIFTIDFSGDCTTQLAIDSVKESSIYISGKYNGNCKCIGNYKSDTISLGKLQDGDYTIHFTLTDIHPDPEYYPVPLNPDEHYELLFSTQRTALTDLYNNSIIKTNPVKNVLTLTLPTDNNEIKIFDLQGKLLLQQNVGSSAEINVSMLPTGTYVLIVNGESYKFVKE
ncbi:MAG: T9SS type A sorting domain-containing protein [Bacteroidales bacterium]|nr:T9SS type A sorting domain-containing protein [Bacteroidales bacterium]